MSNLLTDCNLAIYLIMCTHFPLTVKRMSIFGMLPLNFAYNTRAQAAHEIFKTKWQARGYAATGTRN